MTSLGSPRKTALPRRKPRSCRLPESVFDELGVCFTAFEEASAELQKQNRAMGRNAVELQVLFDVLEEVEESAAFAAAAAA